jgi:hypothetical protein
MQLITKIFCNQLHKYIPAILYYIVLLNISTWLSSNHQYSYTIGQLDTFVKEVGYAFRTWTTRNHTAKYEVKESRDQSERKCDEYQND